METGEMGISFLITITIVIYIGWVIFILSSPKDPMSHNKIAQLMKCKHELRKMDVAMDIHYELVDFLNERISQEQDKLLLSTTEQGQKKN